MTGKLTIVGTSLSFIDTVNGTFEPSARKFTYVQINMNWSGKFRSIKDNGAASVNNSNTLCAEHRTRHYWCMWLVFRLVCIKLFPLWGILVYSLANGELLPERRGNLKPDALSVATTVFSRIRTHDFLYTSRIFPPLSQGCFLRLVYHNYGIIVYIIDSKSNSIAPWQNTCTEIAHVSLFDSTFH